MADRTRFRTSYRGVGRVMTAPGMVAEMGRHARTIRVRAQALAPVGHPPEDWHPGLYRSSFTSGAEVQQRRSGRRAVGYVGNTAPHALAVEYGAQHTPRYRPLGRALAEAEGSSR